MDVTLELDHLNSLCLIYYVKKYNTIFMMQILVRTTSNDINKISFTMNLLKPKGEKQIHKLKLMKCVENFTR